VYIPLIVEYSYSVVVVIVFSGMTGRILFAWVKGHKLDCDAKRWRLFADILNDFAICLEIAAPFTQV
jgi:hypothetical protein